MFKRITVACAALLAAVVSCIAAFPAYADSDTAVKSEYTKTTATYDSPIPDYFGDDKYDTKGNLSLIREEKIIYDSEEMQFIAVTTKDGHVFYILIDYTAIKAAENGEEGADARQTVYFLNKVDDYDLFTLLYDDSDTDINSAYFGRSAGANYFNADTDTAQTQQSSKSSSGGGVPLWLIMVVGIAAVGGIYWFIKIRPNSSSKKAAFDDDDDLDFDDEINVDSENNSAQTYDNYGSGQTEDLSMYGSPDDEEDLM